MFTDRYLIKLHPSERESFPIKVCLLEMLDQAELDKDGYDRIYASLTEQILPCYSYS